MSAGIATRPPMAMAYADPSTLPHRESIDAVLMARAGKEDHAAFRELVERHRNAVIGTVAKMSSSASGNTPSTIARRRNSPPISSPSRGISSSTKVAAAAVKRKSPSKSVRHLPTSTSPPPPSASLMPPYSKVSCSKPSTARSPPCPKPSAWPSSFAVTNRCPTRKLPKSSPSPSPPSRACFSAPAPPSGKRYATIWKSDHPSVVIQPTTKIRQAESPPESVCSHLHPEEIEIKIGDIRADLQQHVDCWH
jgi:hypothetical protein